MVSDQTMRKPDAHSGLALYYYDGCPYCMRVQRVIDRLGIPVEMRNILRDRNHQDDLIAARGRRTVPVLRITDGDGRDEWMPESTDIVDYLEQRFGAQARAGI